jgi:hypothetical protein
MDITSVLVSSAITSGVYVLYKSAIYLYNNYYIKSECHTNSLHIDVVRNEKTENNDNNTAVEQTIKELQDKLKSQLKLQIENK